MPSRGLRAPPALPGKREGTAWNIHWILLVLLPSVFIYLWLWPFSSLRFLLEKLDPQLGGAAQKNPKNTFGILGLEVWEIFRNFLEFFR